MNDIKRGMNDTAGLRVACCEAKISVVALSVHCNSMRWRTFEKDKKTKILF
jgi:hypothetical protein